MPTYGRSTIALQQAKNIFTQIKNLSRDIRFDILFIVSINCDSKYQFNQFKKFAHVVINREDNIGASLNALMGFKKAKELKYDFVWVIGDDEPIAKSALKIVRNKILTKKIDILIGSNHSTGKIQFNRSYQKLSWAIGGTASFISSTVIKCDLIEQEDIECGIDFTFTRYPHLVILNRIIEREETLEICAIPLLSLCRIDKRVHRVVKQPRNNFGFGDSVVFFGKPLTIFAAQTHQYKQRELYLWWSRNWHRVNMFYFKDDYRYDLLCTLSKKYKSLFVFILLGFMPFWRIKDVIKPLKID